MKCTTLLFVPLLPVQNVNIKLLSREKQAFTRWAEGRRKSSSSTADGIQQIQSDQYQYQWIFPVVCMPGWEKQGKESKFWASVVNCRQFQRKKGQILPGLRQLPHSIILCFLYTSSFPSLPGKHILGGVGGGGWKKVTFPWWLPGS